MVAALGLTCTMTPVESVIRIRSWEVSKMRRRSSICWRNACSVRGSAGTDPVTGTRLWLGKLPAAGEEALQYLVTYLQRLSGPQLARVKEEISALLEFARKDGWPRQDTHFLKTFLAEFGVGGETKA